MIEFIGLILLRALSGVQNAFGYAKNFKGLFFATVGLMTGVAAILIITSIREQQVMDIWLVSLTIISMVVSYLGIFGVADSFFEEISILPADVHLWEYLIMPPAMLACFITGGNIWYIILSVYPGLILHKMAVNFGSGLPLWSNRTDDPTGRTVGIPLLNIKIPRLNMNIRAVLAVVSIVIFLILYL